MWWIRSLKKYSSIVLTIIAQWDWLSIVCAKKRWSNLLNSGVMKMMAIASVCSLCSQFRPPLAALSKCLRSAFSAILHKPRMSCEGLWSPPASMISIRSHLALVRSAMLEHSGHLVIFAKLTATFPAM
ncbi:unnamed protein product, partial [Ixodes pacificus]